MTRGVTLDRLRDWLDRRSARESAEAITCREFAAAVGVCLCTAHEIIRSAIASGEAECVGKVQRPGIDGAYHRAPGYRFRRRGKK